MPTEDPTEETPLTKAEMDAALRRMHETHSTLRGTEIVNKDGVVHRVYDAITYEGLHDPKNAELYDKISKAGLAGLIDTAHAETQAKNLDSRFSITTDAEGNILEVQKGYARGFFGNLGHRPTDDDTSYPAVYFHGAWKAGEPATQWNMEGNSVIFWKSRNDDFTYSNEDAASFVPNMPSDRVSVTAQDTNGQAMKITGMPVKNENGEMTQIVGFPVMAQFDELGGYTALSDAAKESFGKRLEGIGNMNGAVAVYDAKGGLTNLLVGRLNRWGDTQMEAVVDIKTGEITELESPVIYNGSSAQQAKNFIETIQPALLVPRTAYIAGGNDANRLIGPIPLAEFRGHESYHEAYQALPENAKKWLGMPIEEAKRRGKTNAVLMTLDTENRIDKVFLGTTAGSLLTVTHRFDCATGRRFASKTPLATAALDPQTEGLLAPEEKAKLFSALQPQMIAVKDGYVVEPMTKRQFRELHIASGQSVPKEIADFIDKRDDHIRIVALLDKAKQPVRLFLGKADKEDNVDIFTTIDCRAERTKWRNFSLEAIPHGRLSSKTAADLAKKSKLLATAPEILSPEMQRAVAQAMDKNYPGKPKPAAEDQIQIAASIPAPTGVRQI